MINTRSQKFKMPLLGFSLVTAIAVLGINIASADVGAPTPPTQISTTEDESWIPKVTYHAGDREILNQDIRDHGISENSWNKFIVSDSSRYRAPKYRRGLYTARTIGEVGYYAAEFLNRGIESWVMAVTLKDSCRKPGRYYNGPYEIYLDSPSENYEFGKWYIKNRERYRKLEKICTIASDKENTFNWYEGSPYNLNKVSSTPSDERVNEARQKKLNRTQSAIFLNEVKLTETCTSVIENFYKEKNIGVAVDWSSGDNFYQARSWFIRDRTCIEDITGLPDDLFRLIFVNNAELFGDTGFPGNRFTANVDLLLRILSETTQLNESNLDKLSKYADELNDGFSEPLDSPNTLKQIGPENFEAYITSYQIMKAAMSCISNNRQREFQIQARSLVVKRLQVPPACTFTSEPSKNQKALCGIQLEKRAKDLRTAIAQLYCR